MLPRRFLLVALLSLGGGPVLLTAGAAAPATPFALTTTDGTPVTDRTYRGKWLLIYFGYTFCPDICPTILSAIAGALDVLGSRATIMQPIFVTIDPQRDTPRILRDYVGAIDQRIVALTGTHTQIAAAARTYGVIYERQDTDNGGYLFDHTSSIYVVDPTGKLVATLTNGTDSATIARRLSDLMKGPS